MTQVINFRKAVEERERLIWKCNCGNCSFILYEDGDLECAECNEFQNGVTEHLKTIRKWTRKGDADMPQNEEN